MKKILSVVGARPNFMKVAPIHRAFGAYSETWEHHIVHTGQHYDAAMSDAFFRDLDMPHPSWFLGVGSGSHAEQTARVMTGFEQVCAEAKPDYVIVVGDVNSTIACALVSVKLGIRTAHVEAGLRSFDRMMPEEINRIATDAIVDDLFVTGASGMAHLQHDGVDPSRIHFVGNTMIDSLLYALPKSEKSTIHVDLGLQPGNYALVTMHRPSNVDDPVQLRMIVDVLSTVASDMPMVFPVHPRTRKNLQNLGIEVPANVHMIDPVGYVDFLALMRLAAFVLTDSGGIQEETTALGVPCITSRTTTERPVTVEIGTNVLVEPTRSGILQAVAMIRSGGMRAGQVPPLWDGHAADRIAAVITAHYS
ncbi:MAG: UDP-N-acetylglucosamine 2-epimerase (non-hydrolyzing) [Ignavibacteria bacterium]|nr:UDP-N-acetylglucosamine 2-epimerase (non-hydrolyzing) [Ignavibacteria bacterium]